MNYKNMLVKITRSGSDQRLGKKGALRQGGTPWLRQ